MNFQGKSKQGFTIIEVVLVLAIGGLIMLMVFLAFPALQRSQNDTQRRNRLSELQTQLVQYQTNNRGKVPNTKESWADLIDDYMNLGRTKNGGTTYNGSATDEISKLNDIKFLDPDGQAYYLAYFCDIKNGTSKSGGYTANTSINGTQPDGSALVVDSANLCKADTIIKTSTLTWDKNRHQIYAFYPAECDGENVKYLTSNATRKVAFVSKLEGAGVFCGNN